MQLASKSRVPHGGWRYVQPETGAEISGRHYRDLVRRVVSHRRANGLPVGTAIELEIARAMCAAMPPDVRSLSCKEEDLPSVSSQFSNIGNSIMRNARAVAEGQGFLTADDMFAHRMAVCSGCEFFRASDKRCARCGCFLRFKTALRAERCPVNKW